VLWIDTLTTLKLASLNLLEPSEPVQGCTGIALLFLHVSTYVFVGVSSLFLFTVRFSGRAPFLPSHSAVDEDISEYVL